MIKCLVGFSNIFSPINIADEVIATASIPGNRKVLHLIVEGRAVLLYQLLSRDVSKEDLLCSIKQLMDAHLIQQTSSTLDELKYFYATAVGLQVEELLGK